MSSGWRRRGERAYLGIVPPDPVHVVVGRVVGEVVSVLGSDEVSNHLNREEDNESSEGGGGGGQVATDLEVFIGTSDTRRIVELAPLGSLAKTRADAVPVGVLGPRSLGDEEDDPFDVPQAGERLRPAEDKCQHRGALDEEMAAAYRRKPGCAVPPLPLLDNSSHHSIVVRRDDDHLPALVPVTHGLLQDPSVGLDGGVVHSVLPFEGGQKLDGEVTTLSDAVVVVVGREEVVDLGRKETRSMSVLARRTGETVTDLVLLFLGELVVSELGGERMLGQAMRRAGRKKTGGQDHSRSGWCWP